MSEQGIVAARRLLAERFGRAAQEAFVADPHVQSAAGGGEIVYFQQYREGIPLFGSNVAVHLDDGTIRGPLKEVDGVDCRPAISASEAVSAALGHFVARTDRSHCEAAHRSLRGRKVPVPIITSSFPLPARPTMVSLGRGKAPAAVHLELFEGMLVWVVRVPFRTDTFLLLVAANGERAREVVFCTPWSSSARCTGHVTGFDDVRALCDFPAPASLYPQPLVAGAAPFADWITLDATSGNNVVTHFGNPEKLVRAAAGSFANPLPEHDQWLLNAFFFCNYLHDFFLLLGFGENEGNFQTTNATGIPGGGDRLIVKVFTSLFEHLGKMEAHLDGEPAVLKLGVAPNKEQAALHCDVVIHEYAHGVTQRMVGGRRGAASLVRRQSLALSEAWSDYFAITLRNHHLAQKNFAFAGWAGQKKPARSAPYDEHYRADFGRLGKKPHDDAHGAGEIMAVALIRFNQLLGRNLGNDAVRGDCIGWRVIIESLRHCEPSNPTFLDARDAVFTAITQLGQQLTGAEAAAAHAAAREAFADAGMGPAAQGPPSNQLTGAVADFNQ